MGGGGQAGEQGGGGQEGPDPAPAARQGPGAAAGRQRPGREGVGGERAGDPGRGGAGGRVAGEGVLDQLAQRPVDAGQVGWIVEDAVDDRLGRAAAEGVAAGGGERDQGAPGEHVGGRPGRLVAQLLGRHPGGRAQAQPRPCHGGIGGPGDPEVDHLHARARRLLEQDVAGLEVTVDDAGGVDGGEGPGDPGRERDQAPAGQRSAAGDRAVKGGAVDVLGGEPGPGAGRVGVEDPRHLRAVHAAGGVDLAPEAGGEGRVAGELWPQRLDRGQTAAAVPAQEDHAHAALAEAAGQLVGAESPGVARLPWKDLPSHRCLRPLVELLL